jgi:hypothetical protein
MKKLFAFVFIFILTLTVLNISRIDTKKDLNNQLAYLITSARADGEGGSGCYQQVISFTYTYYKDQCNWDAWLDYTCEWGSDPMCRTGTTNATVTNCTGTEWGSLTLHVCS